MIANETTLHKRPNDKALCHRTALNNEQNPYRIVSYKRPRKDICKTIKKRKPTA